MKSLSTPRAILYAAGNAGSGMPFAFMNGAVPLYLGGYGVPNAWIGLLSQERPPLAGISQIVVGALSDRTRSRLGRRRPYMLAGIPVAAAALLGLIPHPPLWVVVALLLVLTTSFAVAYGPYLTLLVDLVPAERRGRVGGLLAITGMLGQLLILVVAMQIWETAEPVVFLLVAGGLLAGFALTVRFVPEPRPLRHAPGAGERRGGRRLALRQGSPRSAAFEHPRTCHQRLDADNVRPRQVVARPLLTSHCLAAPHWSDRRTW